jgi:hypothetical protein
MDYQFIKELLTTTLVELDLPAATSFARTMLMKGGYFVGWKFRYDGGYVVLRTGDNTVELYDVQGNLLKSVALEIKREAA